MDTETVVRVRAGQVADPYSGETSPTWAEADVSKIDIPTLAPPEPRPSSEPVQDARNAVVSGWTLYLPADSDVTAADRMRVRGIDYPVQGQPAIWGTRGLVVQAFGTAG